MAKRIGRQTPTQAVVLPYASTKGGQAVKLYELSGRTAQEWQRNLIDAVMARNNDGLWTHPRFGYSIPRRNGKSEVLLMRELWGLATGEKILHTAHRTTTTHSTWEKLFGLVTKCGLPVKMAIRAYGRERIDIAGGGRIEFRTRTNKGGLGEGYDLLIIDEAQEYQDDQESALKYIVTDSKNPQTLFCGTPPTASSSGTVFPKLRDAALAGDTQDVGWAEWGVDAKHDPSDVDAWYKTNPSLGTIFTERSVRAEIGTDDVDFNIQRLGLWIKYDLKSEITAAEWETMRVDTMPELQGPLFAGVKFGKDGTSVALSIAVKTEDGRIFAETVDCRPIRAGNAWILQFLQSAGCAQVVIDGASGQQLLAAQMAEAKIRPPVLPTVKEIITANAQFVQELEAKALCHAGQPSLVQAVTNCERRAIGSNGGFGFKALRDDIEIALMDSMILAVWACANAKPPKGQKISY